MEITEKDCLEKVNFTVSQSLTQPSPTTPDHFHFLAHCMQLYPALLLFLFPILLPHYFFLNNWSTFHFIHSSRPISKVLKQIEKQCTQPLHFNLGFSGHAVLTQKWCQWLEFHRLNYGSQLHSHAHGYLHCFGIFLPPVSSVSLEARK